MKIRDGFVSNSSTTSFTLKDTTGDIQDFDRKLNLFLKCAEICDYLNFDLKELDCYLENNKIKISTTEDYLDPKIKDIIYAIFDVEEEHK